MGSEYTKNQLNYRRSLGVSRAWERERELVRKGRGTRQWSVKEQKELLKTGRIKGYHGHHMKSVAKHPEYADNPKNIQFLNSRKGSNEHLKAHRGDYRNESNGRYTVQTGRVRPMKDGAPRAMNSYELKDKAIEKRGYGKYASMKSGQKNGSAQTQGKNGFTEFNGKTYGRAFVRSSGQAQERGGRYGEKTSMFSKGARQTGSPGQHVQKASVRSQFAAKSSYGGSKASSGGQAQGTSASHSAGRGADGHGQGGAHK